MTPDLAEVHEEHIAILRAGREWWHDGERWSVVMDMVYGDVSGSNANVLSVGCYLGKEHRWIEAIAAWCRALDDAKVREFHATDFFNAQGEFDDDKWRRHIPGRGMVVGGELHEEFAERFTSIPVNHDLIGFALALDAPAFVQILAPEYANEKRKCRIADPKTHAIMTCLGLLDDFFIERRYNVPASVQAIFEHESGAGKFIDFFNESKARRERWTFWLKSFTVAPKSFVPLLMADLLAHETWRRIKDVWSPSPRPIRKSFERMIGDGRIQFRYHDRPNLIKCAETVRDILSRYPDGLVPPEDTKDAPI
jgi:hypothetical protein